jgi:hypothetical protein
MPVNDNAEAIQQPQPQPQQKGWLERLGDFFSGDWAAQQQQQQQPQQQEELPPPYHDPEDVDYEGAKKLGQLPPHNEEDNPAERVRLQANVERYNRLRNPDYAPKVPREDIIAKQSPQYLQQYRAIQDQQRALGHRHAHEIGRNQLNPYATDSDLIGIGQKGRLIANMGATDVMRYYNIDEHPFEFFNNLSDDELAALAYQGMMESNSGGDQGSRITPELAWAHHRTGLLAQKILNSRGNTQRYRPYDIMDYKVAQKYKRLASNPDVPREEVERLMGAARLGTSSDIWRGAPIISSKHYKQSQRRPTNAAIPEVEKIREEMRRNTERFGQSLPGQPAGGGLAGNRGIIAARSRQFQAAVDPFTHSPRRIAPLAAPVTTNRPEPFLPPAEVKQWDYRRNPFVPPIRELRPHNPTPFQTQENWRRNPEPVLKTTGRLNPLNALREKLNNPPPPPPSMRMEEPSVRKFFPEANYMKNRVSLRDRRELERLNVPLGMPVGGIQMAPPPQQPQAAPQMMLPQPLMSAATIARRRVGEDEDLRDFRRGARRPASRRPHEYHTPFGTSPLQAIPERLRPRATEYSERMYMPGSRKAIKQFSGQLSAGLGNLGQSFGSRNKAPLERFQPQSKPPVSHSTFPANSPFPSRVNPKFDTLVVDNGDRLRRTLNSLRRREYANRPPVPTDPLNFKGLREIRNLGTDLSSVEKAERLIVKEARAVRDEAEKQKILGYYRNAKKGFMFKNIDEEDYKRALNTTLENLNRVLSMQLRK